jgi:hypothetical protein
MLRLRHLVVAALLALGIAACEGPQAGGQSGSDAMRCKKVAAPEEDPRVPSLIAQTNELGAAFDLEWWDTHTVTQATLTLTRAEGPVLLNGGDEDGGGCESDFYVPVQLHLTTADGLLDETWSGELGYNEYVDTLTVFAQATFDEVGGSYQFEGPPDAQPYFLLRLRPSQAAEGTLGYLWHCSTPDAEIHGGSDLAVIPPRPGHVDYGTDESECSDGSITYEVNDGY